MILLIGRPLLFGRTRDRLLTDERFLNWATEVLRSADTGISRVIVQERKLREGRSELISGISQRLGVSLDDDVWGIWGDFLADPKVEVRTARCMPGSTEEVVWDVAHESDETQEMLQLLGPIYGALQLGGVLFVDELDTSLHPHLTRQLVRLFHDPESNPKGAQLIFTTHDTSLLDPTLFRRDQIWFTAKDASGATDLYSLDDYKPRKDEALQKGYLAGRYGAVPVLERFESAVSAKKPDKTAGDG